VDEGLPDQSSQIMLPDLREFAFRRARLQRPRLNEVTSLRASRSPTTVRLQAGLRFFPSLADGGHSVGTGGFDGKGLIWQGAPE
jgi:hypothetical protein